MRAVGYILDIGKSFALDKHGNLLPREAQHGMHHKSLRLRTRTDAMQPGNARAPEQVEEKGLNGIVAMVGCGHTCVAMLRTQLPEEIVALLTRLFLDGTAALPRQFGSADLTHMATYSVAQGKGTDERLIAVAIARPEVEVAMGYGETEAASVHELAKHG